ncbi:hypothetical protein Tco_0795968 [Tanacetum coccineum]
MLTSDVNVGVRSVKEINIEVLYDGWNKMFVQMFIGFAAPELAALELVVSQNSQLQNSRLQNLQFLITRSSRTRSFSEFVSPDVAVFQNSQFFRIHSFSELAVFQNSQFLELAVFRIRSSQNLQFSTVNLTRSFPVLT